MIAMNTVEDATDILHECGWDLFAANIFEAELTRVISDFKELCPNPILAEIVFAKASFDQEGAADIKTIQNYYNQQFARLKQLKNKDITNYFKAELDLLNLRTFAKVRAIGSKPSNIFIEGGNVTEGELMSIFERNTAKVKTAIGNLEFSELLDKLTEGLDSGSLTEFENASQSYLVKLSKEGGEDSFRLNPLFHWYIAKMEELRVVKTILTGKKFGKSKEKIREELQGVL